MCIRDSLLMAAPQMLAYILQVNFWLEHYRVEILT